MAHPSTQHSVVDARDVPQDLAAWRKQQRAALIARREAVDAATMNGWRQAMDGHVERGFPGLARGVVALCWPYKNEYDARHLAALLRRKGAVTALPVVVAPRTPLIFREWHPGVALARGPLGIRHPVDTPEVKPTVVLLPMVGFDEAGYRLGYGGGFFDRTLAAMNPKPAVIGVAHELARMKTIYPQPYDMGADYVVTERGIYRRDAGTEGPQLVFLGAPLPGEPSVLASPVCYAGELDPESKGPSS
jgi:5,10-methenyltetrahydrofolate synthetase